MRPGPLTFTIYRARDGWRWRCRARNRRTVAESGEAYTRRRDCQAAIRRLWYGCQRDARLVLPGDELARIRRFLIARS